MQINRTNQNNTSFGMAKHIDPISFNHFSEKALDHLNIAFTELEQELQKETEGFYTVFYGSTDKSGKPAMSVLTMPEKFNELSGIIKYACKLFIERFGDKTLSDQLSPFADKKTILDSVKATVSACKKEFGIVSNIANVEAPAMEVKPYTPFEVWA